jgi:hypothetical protein
MVTKSSGRSISAVRALERVENKLSEGEQIVNNDLPLGSSASCDYNVVRLLAQDKSWKSESTDGSYVHSI